MTELTDVELWNAYRRQADNEAFTELEKRYHEAVIHWAFQLQPALAEEVAQETWHRVSRYRSFEPGKGVRFATWLRKITVNVARNACRGCRGRFVEVQSIDDIPSPDPPPEVSVIEQELLLRLEECIRRLPLEFRCIVDLNRQAWKFTQVARFRACANSTIAERGTKANEMLRVCMERQPEITTEVAGEPKRSPVEAGFSQKFVEALRLPRRAIVDLHARHWSDADVGALLGRSARSICLRRTAIERRLEGEWKRARQSGQTAAKE